MGVIYLHGVAYGKGSGGGGGTNDYNDLENKPKINNTTLTGNKTTTDLGLVDGTTIYVDPNNKLVVGTISKDQVDDLFTP